MDKEVTGTIYFLLTVHLPYKELYQESVLQDLSQKILFLLVGNSLSSWTTHKINEHEPLCDIPIIELNCYLNLTLPFNFSLVYVLSLQLNCKVLEGHRTCIPFSILTTVSFIVFGRYSINIDGQGKILKNTRPVLYVSAASSVL